jgi:hypothetical protein
MYCKLEPKDTINHFKFQAKVSAQKPEIVCTQCHCETCFKNFKPTTNRSKSETGSRLTGFTGSRSTGLAGYGNDIESHFKLEEASQDHSKLVKVPWTEDWFKDIVTFRKEAFWDCHAETTKI